MGAAGELRVIEGPDSDESRHTEVSRSLVEEFGDLGGITLSLYEQMRDGPKRNLTPEAVYREVKDTLTYKAILYFEGGEPKVKLPKHYTPYAFAIDPYCKIYYVIARYQSERSKELEKAEHFLLERMENSWLSFFIDLALQVIGFTPREMTLNKLEHIKAEQQKARLEEYELFVLKQGMPMGHVPGVHSTSFGELGFSLYYYAGCSKVYIKVFKGRVVSANYDGVPFKLEMLPLESVSVAR